MPKLLEAMLSNPQPKEEVIEDNEPREEMLDAFRDFSDEEMPATERMDALLLLIELAKS